MKKNGFTLIELLAVILILGVIALIATPIILNIGDDSKKTSATHSAHLYVHGLMNQIMVDKIKSDFNPTECTIANGNVSCGTKSIDYNPSGSKPTSGTISFSNGDVTGYDLCIMGYKVIKNVDTVTATKDSICTAQNSNTSQEQKCTYVDNDSSSSITRGDKVSCPLSCTVSNCSNSTKTESFYVMSTTQNSVIMLSEYNLNVSENENLYSGTPIGYQDSHVVGFDYGTVKFDSSSTQYNSASIKGYVDNYALALRNSISESNAIGRLITGEELGCSSPSYCPNLTSVDSWLYSTSYWSSYNNSDSGIWCVLFNGNTVLVLNNNSDGFGVRPVIEISSSAIQAP